MKCPYLACPAVLQRSRLGTCAADRGSVWGCGVGRESGGLARPLPRLKMRLREGCASRAECVRMGVAGEPAAMAAVLRDELQHLTLPAEGKY